MRKSNGMNVLVCALAAMAPGSAHAQSNSSQSLQRAQSEFRVYDVSDLLPEAVRAIVPVGMTVTEAAKLKASRGAGEVEMHRVEPVSIAMDLAAMLNVDSIALGPGVIGVLAEPAEQEAFAKALDTLHDTYSERAAIRIAVYEVDPDADLKIGAHSNPEWGQPIRQMHQAIRRLVQTPMSSVTTHRFVERVLVISGTGGLGYQPGGIPEVTEGLDISVRVGASSKGSGSLVDVQGEFSRVDIRKMEMKGFIGNPTGAIGESVGPFELPTVERRPIHSAVRVREGEETVIAVMDDPDAESWLVVTVKVSAVR